MKKKGFSYKNDTGQAASTVGGMSASEVIDEGQRIGNANDKEEDMSMARHPGVLLISSYQALCDDEKDWPNVEAKERCGIQVTLYYTYLYLDRPFLVGKHRESEEKKTLAIQSLARPTKQLLINPRPLCV